MYLHQLSSCVYDEARTLLMSGLEDSCQNAAGCRTVCLARENCYQSTPVGPYCALRDSHPVVAIATLKTLFLLFLSFPDFHAVTAPS